MVHRFMDRGGNGGAEAVASYWAYLSDDPAAPGDWASCVEDVLAVDKPARVIDDDHQ